MPGFIQPQGFSYLTGWLFEIGSGGQKQYYFVVTDSDIYGAGSVIAQPEIEEKIGQSILPIYAETGLSQAQIAGLKAKAKADILAAYGSNKDEIQEVFDPILEFRKKLGGGTDPWYYVVQLIGAKNCYVVGFDPTDGNVGVDSIYENAECRGAFIALANNEAEKIVANYLASKGVSGTIGKKYFVSYHFTP
ncbi:MAG: hypothetical protein NT067_05005 [Candidatus Diapherotrites archaeon]|nr:hypothetical protein [Candidatus Diapherotrites archaeon]